MKKILLLLLLCSFVSYSQKKDEITDAVKRVLTDDVKGLSDKELKILIERFNQANKEIKDSKDFSIETNNVAKTEFDTITSEEKFKKSKIYQLKAETEGNYFVVKYIDLDLCLTNYTTLREFYESLAKNSDETKEAFMIRKNISYKAKNDANPFKVYYGYLSANEVILTKTSALVSFNIATVPFKIFPKTSYPSSVSGDIDNIGLYTGLRFKDWSFLKANGKETNLNYGMGLFLAPSVVKLNKDNSSIESDEEVNKPYLTTALAVHIKYQNFTIMIIPCGVDIAFSDSGKKWNYDGKYWWGFGLGIDTSLFNF